jgi:ubiquinone/menaquinone biosynthesis C-methylase UbiE
MAEHSEAIERAFTQQAEAFENPEFNRLFTTASDWLFERLPLNADDLVLDVAAGTGHVARRMAPHVRAAIAIDATEAMLEAGRVEAKRAALRNIVFMRADAAQLPFLDGSFDIVVSRFAVHHFEKPEVQLAEMRRCLRMGGRLAIGDLIADPDPEVAAVQNRLERLRDPSHTRMLSLEALADLVGSTDVEFRDVERTLGPWLEQTNTPPEARAEIREALEAELAGGPPTGFRPREVDGQLGFLHTAASIIA